MENGLAADGFQQLIGIDDMAVDVVQNLQLIVLDLLGGCTAGILNQPDLEALISQGTDGANPYYEYDRVRGVLGIRFHY